MNEQNVEADLSDIDFHGFRATKTTLISETIVTETIIDTIRIGCKITAVNGVMTSTLKHDELELILAGRDYRIRPTVIPYEQDDTAYDAVQ